MGQFLIYLVHIKYRDFMQYIFKDGYAIGYMHGDREVFFQTQILISVIGAE